MGEVSGIEWYLTSKLRSDIRVLCMCMLPWSCLLDLQVKNLIHFVVVFTSLQSCSFFNSNTVPLKLSFNNADPFGDNISIIFKVMCGLSLSATCITVKTVCALLVTMISRWKG